MKEISHFPLKLPVEKIKRRLKIPARVGIKDYDALIDKFFTLVEPRARYDSIKISLRGNKIGFKDEYEIISGSLKRHLRHHRLYSPGSPNLYLFSFRLFPST